MTIRQVILLNDDTTSDIIKKKSTFTLNDTQIVYQQIDYDYILPISILGIPTPCLILSQALPTNSF